jgi:PAS domain S-box-containing protein
MQIADLLPEPTLLLSSRGEILAANAAVQSRLGHPARAIVGRSIVELVVESPNEIAGYLEACGGTQSLTAGAMVVRGPDAHRIPCRCEGARLQGGHDDAAAQLLLRLVPRDLVVGHFLALNQRIMEMSKEIQRRLSAEHALRRQEEWWRVTLASVGDAVIVTDARGRVLTLNAMARTITGWSELDAVGRTLQEVLPLVDEVTKQPVPDLVSRTIAHDGIIEMRNQLMLTTPESETRYIDDSAAPIKDEHGELMGVVLVLRDVTERRRAERALRDADRRKDEFLAFLAHELRNPLAPIRNSIEILRLSGNDPSLIDRARAILDRQVQQMVRLIDDLLDLSRISTGRLELRCERVELQRVVLDAVETSRPVIEAHGQELSIALPSEPIVLDADTTRLSQVFSNLLNNSAKYSEPGGRITLSAERDRSRVTVSVKDTGIGISAIDLPRVFDMFAQVDASQLRAKDGLGVGLSLVQRLVRMHGGEIEARSEGPNRGSEFVIRLPTVTLEAHAAPAEIHQAEDSRDLRTRVLVADDYRDSADSLTVMLRHFGADVRTAYDGQQAVDVAEEFRPDVALLDLGMPKLSGYDAARRIAQRPWSHNVVLIALTGWGQDADRERTRSAGFHYHLVKPVEFASLYKLLKSLRPGVVPSEQRLTTR